MWLMENIWTVVDRLHQNTWFPVILSTYGIDLDSRKLAKILYVDGNSDIPW
jgi:hypothetical protein